MKTENDMSRAYEVSWVLFWVQRIFGVIPVSVSRLGVDAGVMCVVRLSRSFEIVTNMLRFALGRLRFRILIEPYIG